LGPQANVERRPAEIPAAIVHARSSHPTLCWRKSDSNPRSPGGGRRIQDGRYQR
jgi:hypothetical protein